MASRSLLLVTCAAALVCGAAAQFGMPGMGGGEAPKAAAVKSDLPFIRCQTCEALVKQAYRHTKSKREGLKSHQKLEESDIIEYLEKMCDPATPDGAWITHYDMVEQGSEIKLVDKGQPSKCNTECATIARACAQLTDELDLSDLSEALFTGKGRSALTSDACYESTSACRKKAPPVPKDRKPGPAHTPMSADELQREQLMASMKAAGLGGQMFSRDDVMNQLDGLKEAGEAGDIPTTRLTEMGGGLTETVADTVAKASEAVQDAVGSAAEAAAAVVDKAGGFLKDTLGKLGSSFSKGDQGAAEL